MKKILSLMLATIITVTSFIFPITASAAQTHIEGTIQSLQTTKGYIPGGNAAVTGNCFGFVSAVCQKVYGVTYYNEQFNGSYQFNHSTGNYYTVAASTYAKPNNTAEWTASATAIRDFMLSNAAAGDILQYGCANKSSTHMHTAIVQHIDSEKMIIFHSNYASGNYNAASCHTDTIYWNNFIARPNSNDLDAFGNTISLNKYFGAPLNCSNGLGLSINRYSKLESLYFLDTAVMPAPTVKTERKSTTSIKFSWNTVGSAVSYGYYLTDQFGNKIVNDSFTANTDVTLTGLKTGEFYTFYLYAMDSIGENGQVSSCTIQCLPPAPKAPQITSTSGNGISLSWAKRSDISGCNIWRSTSGGDYELIANITDGSASTFTDYNVANNVVYNYKVQRYVYSDAGIFGSSVSKASADAQIILTAPKGVKVVNTTSSSMKVSWNAVPGASSYVVTYGLKGSNSKKRVTVVGTSLSVTGRKLKKTYVFYVRAVNALGKSPNSKAYKKKMLPPTPVSVKASRPSSQKIKVAWNNCSGYDGSYILRSTSKKFNKNVKKIKIKSKKNYYVDKNVKKGTVYYYKVCRYDGSVIGSYSKTVKIKCK